MGKQGFVLFRLGFEALCYNVHLFVQLANYPPAYHNLAASAPLYLSSGVMLRASPVN